jgi:outer membrane protein assembly factor BamB
MGIGSFIKKQFIDVLQWNEDTDGVLAWRYPMADQEIQNGGQLVVRESQVAVFVNEGQIADVFGPGTHKLTTQTLPLLTNLKNWDKLFDRRSSRMCTSSAPACRPAANGARRSRSPSATRTSTWCACAPSACTPTA